MSIIQSFRGLHHSRLCERLPTQSRQPYITQPCPSPSCPVSVQISRQPARIGWALTDRNTAAKACLWPKAFATAGVVLPADFRERSLLVHIPKSSLPIAAFLYRHAVDEHPASFPSMGLAQTSRMISPRRQPQTGQKASNERRRATVRSSHTQS